MVSRSDPGPLQLAEHATTTIRDLIYQTRGQHAFADPAELSRLLAEVTVTVSSLPPLLNQLHYWLCQEHDAARLQADTDNDPDQIVLASAAELTHATRTARDLALALDTAHQHLAQLATAPPATRHPTEERPTNRTKGVSFRP